MRKVKERCAVCNKTHREVLRPLPKKLLDLPAARRTSLGIQDLSSTGACNREYKIVVKAFNALPDLAITRSTMGSQPGDAAGARDPGTGAGGGDSPPAPTGTLPKAPPRDDPS